MSDTNELKELLAKANANKATATEKIKLAELLNISAKDEAKAEFDAKIVKVKDFISKQGLDLHEVSKAIAKPASLIFQWNNHKRFEGEKGKLPAWVAEMVKTVDEVKAFTYVVGGNEKGKTFVKNIYHPKQKQ